MVMVRVRVRVRRDIRGMGGVRCLCYYDDAIVALASHCIITIMFLSQTIFSNMAMALYMPTLNSTMHLRAGRGQHNHPPLVRSRFSLLVTATMADGVSPTHHTVRVIF
jgi:hypothetical protein